MARTIFDDWVHLLDDGQLDGTRLDDGQLSHEQLDDRHISTWPRE